ncbi:GNAT family N-acetyltransferase [Clostridium estertheticum]|uniref:GNAT family N-acetyltransferase n=1 Tax=Clostridium estertheticum TaxID=238834 RepID=A0A5N7J1C3_9CLOT|nr:GNAT family protein [Clostridium estertheticum]MPQ31852.1 GNAT family N-acetyltransferase [Clostridium estertheticum]MPQ62519.1 GNAT family N-acetyltransferase [Clostridium estertheticum]
MRRFHYATRKRELSQEQREELLKALKDRFEKNMSHHKDIFCGNGYMKEAMKEIIAIAMGSMNIKDANACIYIENQSSIHLAENLGFILSGSSCELFREKEYLHNRYSLYITN